MSTSNNSPKSNTKIKPNSEQKLEAELFATVCADRKDEPFIGAFAHNEKNISKQKNGQLFGIVQVTDRSDNSSYLPNLLIQVIKKEFYRSRYRSLEENFEAALRKANIDLADLVEKEIAQWVGHLNVALGALKKDQFIFTISGDAKIFLARNQRLVDIGKDLNDEESLNPIKTFNNVSSGQLQAGDKIILLPASALKIISTENLRRHLRTLPSDEFDNLLKSTIEAEGSYESLAIVNLQDQTKEQTFLTEITNKPMGNYFGTQTEESVVALPEEELSARLSENPLIPSLEGKEPETSPSTEEKTNDLLTPTTALFSDQTAADQLSINKATHDKEPLDTKEQLSPFEEQPEIFISEDDHFEITPPLKKRKGAKEKLGEFLKKSSLLKNSFTGLQEKFIGEKITPEEEKKPDESPIISKEKGVDNTKASLKKKPLAKKEISTSSTSTNLEPKSTLDFLTALKAAQIKIKSGSSIVTTSAIAFSKKAIDQGKIIGGKTISHLDTSTKNLTAWSKKTISQTNKAVKNKELWRSEKKKKLLIQEVSRQEDVTEVVSSPENIEEVVLNNGTNLILESSQKLPKKEKPSHTKAVVSKPEPVLMDGLQRKPSPKKRSRKSKKITHLESPIPEEIDNFDEFFGELSAEIKAKEERMKKKFDSFWEDELENTNDFFKKEAEEELKLPKKSSSQEENSTIKSSQKSAAIKTLKYILPLLLIGAIAGGTIYFWPQFKKLNEKVSTKETSIKEEPVSVQPIEPSEVIENNLENDLGEISNALTIGQAKNSITALGLADEVAFAITDNGDSLIEFKNDQEVEVYPLSKTNSTTNDLVYLNSLKLIIILGEDNKAFQSFSPITKKTESQKITLPNNFKLAGVGSYLDYIYLLDKNTGQIYRYPRAEGGFGESKQWLKSPLLDKEIFDMAVDEKIRLILADGSIETFANGKSEDKTIIKDLSPNKIFTHNDLKYYYLLDKAQGKIAQLDKSNNQVLKEVTDSKLKIATDFVINKDETEIIFSVEKELLKLTF